MKSFRRHRRIVTLALMLIASGGVSAQDDDEAEITIRLMGAPDAQLPEAVTEQIVLPPAAREDAAAVDNARRGAERADDENSRRDEGLERADEARERGAEMSDEARENAENRGRSEEHRPDPPGPPDDPGPRN